MMLSTVIAGTALFATLGLSAPTADLAKRAEGIHLTNCIPNGGSIDGAVSAVIYCSNDSSCHPSASDFCTISPRLPGPAPNFFHWEGGSFSCAFSSGVKFSWDLPSDAQSRPNYAVVDTSASNGFRGWTGHKDDQTKSISFGGFSCVSIYYYL